MVFERPAFEPTPLAEIRRLGDRDAVAESERFLALMRQRRSIRSFDPSPVPEQVILNAVAAAGSAPSGANQQPWHFCAIQDPVMKARIRERFEETEESFYEKQDDQEWLKAVHPLGTSKSKPQLTDAPWLIAVFAKLWGEEEDGRRYKHYYVLESVGIAVGVLITALHSAGVYSLAHTSRDMQFLNRLCQRPNNEKPLMVFAIGHPSVSTTVPSAAVYKKPLGEIMTFHRSAKPPLRSIP